MTCRNFQHKAPNSIRGPLTSDSHLHTGKPWQPFGGLCWYDNAARWYDPTTCAFATPDPMADKYPHLSPFAHCGGNPMRYIDMRGDSLTLVGKSPHIDKALRMYEKGMGDLLTMGVNERGLVNMSFKPGMGTSDMTVLQQRYYQKMDMIVNREGMTTIKVKENSRVFIGSANDRAIDVGDMSKFSYDKPITPSVLIGHETYEQFLLQVGCKELKNAHSSAITFEELITNLKLGDDPKDRDYDGSGVFQIFYWPDGIKKSVTVMYSPQTNNIISIKY